MSALAYASGYDVGGSGITTERDEHIETMRKTKPTRTKRGARRGLATLDYVLLLGVIFPLGCVHFSGRSADHSPDV